MQLALAIFVVSAAVSLAASVLLVSRLEGRVPNVV